VSCTLRDVARLAGVSMATVSRVINNASNVSDDTRSKVASAIAELKFSPDLHAVQLRRGKDASSRPRRKHDLSSTRSVAEERHSDSSSKRLKHEQRVARSRLLEEENARLKRLVANLCLDVEIWKRIAQ